MAGLAHELLADLRNVLLDCGPLASASDLRTVFVDQRIKPWRDNLPDASSTTSRMDIVISYLIDRRNRGGENALLLFIQVLRDRANKEEACYDELVAMAERLEEALAQPGAAASPQLISQTPPGSVDLVRLHENLAQYFSAEDLQTLCFGLNVDFDDLPGEGKGAKARELVMYMERRGHTADLIAKARKERPHISW